MTVPIPPLLEFPSMLHGLTEGIRQEVRAQGQQWAQEYLETGGFTLPRRMSQVSPGEPLLMHAATEFEFMDIPGWRIHGLMSVFTTVFDSVPDELDLLVRKSFEAFCLETPWGALYYSLSPTRIQSAERMAQRFTALLRFWDVLQGPRYADYEFNTRYTLDGYVSFIHQVTMEAWCPGPFTSVREHLSHVAQRMAKATREESIEAMLRVIPYLLHVQPKIPHRERLGDPDFARECLAKVSADDFEAASSADRFKVNGLLHAWSRVLSRQ